MVFIKTLKDKLGNVLYPQTKEKAVYDDSNVRLDNKLANLLISIAGKLDKASLLQNAETSDASKVHSAAVTAAQASQISSLASSLNETNNNLARFGQFIIQDNDVAISAGNTIVPFTFVSANQDNYYTVNANGTIGCPKGTYIVTVTLHGILMANDIMAFVLVCGNSVANDVRVGIDTMQFNISLTLIVKADTASTIQLFARSSLGSSYIIGKAIAADSLLSIQKIA